MNNKKLRMIQGFMLGCLVSTLVGCAKNETRIVTVDNLTLEISERYTTEVDGEDVYIYLPINFDESDVPIKISVDDKVVSSEPLNRMLKRMDPYIPQEIIEEVFIDHVLLTVHVIVE